MLNNPFFVGLQLSDLGSCLVPRHRQTTLETFWVPCLGRETCSLVVLGTKKQVINQSQLSCHCPDLTIPVFWFARRRFMDISPARPSSFTPLQSCSLSSPVYWFMPIPDLDVRRVGTYVRAWCLGNSFTFICRLDSRKESPVKLLAAPACC
jgi:hypothetical protein